MVLSVSDNFERAGPLLGANWSVLVGGAGGEVQIYDSSDAGVNIASSQEVYWNADAFPDDQYSEVVISAFGGEIVALVRGHTTGGFNRYGVSADGSGYNALEKQVNGAWTQLANLSTTPVVGDTLRIEAEGTTIRVLLNGAEVASVTDSSHTAGSAGFGFFDGHNGGRIENWAAGSLPISLRGTATVGFSGDNPRTLGVTIPSTTRAGDIILVSLMVEDNGSAPSVTAPAGEGYTNDVAVENTSGGLDDLWVYEFWKVADSGDAGQTHNFDASNIVWSGAIASVWYWPVGSGDPNDVTPVTNIGGPDLSPVASDITPATEPHMEIVTAIGWDGSGATAPTGMAEAVDASGFTHAYLRRTTTSAPGSRTVTQTGNGGNNYWITVHRLFRESDSGGGGNQDLTLTGIASALALGSPTITVGPVTVSPAGIAGTLALGGPTLQPGAVTVSPDGLASTAALGSPTLTSSLLLAPAGIPSSAALGTPALAPGAVTILLNGVASTQAFGDPVVALSGVQNVQPAGIASTQAFGSPALTSIVTVSPEGVAGTTALGEPALHLVVLVSGVVSAAALGSVTLTPGTVTVSPLGIASSDRFGSPVVLGGETPEVGRRITVVVGIPYGGFHGYRGPVLG